MNRKVPYDRILIFVLLGLVVSGLVIVFSASAVVSRQLYGSPTTIFLKQLFSVGIGLVLLAVTMRIDYRKYNHRIVVYSACFASILLLILPFLEAGTKGASRWIHLGPASFQPSEPAKVAIVLLTAHVLITSRGRLERLDKTTLSYLLLVGLAVALILAEPDLGTAVDISVVVGLMLFVGGLRYRYYIASALSALPLSYLFVYQVPYRRARLLAFLEPSRDPFGASYQINQSLMAIGSGGVSGMGFGQGAHKHFFLPELHTDFVYALVAQELGMLGALFLLLLFCLLLWRGVKVALRADTLFGTYLSLGIVFMIVFQAFFNISVTLGLLPTKGIPLPFISSGGSATLVMMGAYGVLLNISMHTRGQRSRLEWLSEGKRRQPPESSSV